MRATQKPENNVIDFEKAKEHLEFKKGLEQRIEQVQKLRSDPRAKIDHGDVMMFHDFKLRFNRVLPKNPNIVVLNPDHHFEMQVAFQNGVFTYLEDTKQKADWLQDLGLDAVKLELDSQKLPGKAEVDIIVAVNDKDIRGSEKLLGNIREGCWVLCLSDLARSLIETGNFTCEAMLDSEHGGPHIERSGDDDHWEYAVKTDAEFKSASEKLPSDSKFVTYEEAKAALTAAGRKTGEKSGQVLESYKQFLRDTGPDGTLKSSDEAGTAGNEEEAVKKIPGLKRELPLGDNTTGKILALRRKRRGVD